MANIFQDKIVKYLTVGLVLAVVAMLAQTLLAKPQALPDLQLSAGILPETLPKIPSVALDPKNLDNLKVEDLKPFELVDFPVRVGRDNPFEPYPLVEEIPTSTVATTSGADLATSTLPIATSTIEALTPTTTTIVQ